MTYQPQWSPPPGGWDYPPPPPPQAPKQPGIAWLWAVIACLIVVAVVRLGWTPTPTVQPTAPNVPYSTPTTPVPPPSTKPGADPTGGFCTMYYIFSIEVTTSQDAFNSAISQGDATAASTLADQFYTQAQAMQQTAPPADLAAQVDTVATDFRTAKDALSTGSVANVPAADGIWSDVTALQTAADAACG